MKKLISLLLALCLAAALLTGCGQQNNSKGTSRSNTTEVPSASGDIFAMDTYMTVTTYGEKCEEALKAAEDEINRLDALLSVGNADSEISQINADGSGELSDDTQTMVQKALDIWQTTGGAFDITVYPIMQAWGFTTGDYKVPSELELQTLLQTAGSEKLTLDGAQLTLGEGQGIDLGGIAKGFTSARLMEIFEQYDLTAGLVSLGGNVQCYGTKPDGSLWRCGIQDPNDPENQNALLGILSVSDKAVITSGAYERNFTDPATGAFYHHIIDPATGAPAESGLSSVTVVSADGTLADGLSTACYVMGLEKSIAYWQTYGEQENFDLILMTDDGAVYVTAPLADNFTSDYEVQVIGQCGGS